jgi:hypothetical protein
MYARLHTDYLRICNVATQFRPHNMTHEETRLEPGPGITADNAQNFLHAENSYIRIVSKGRIIYRHPTAGRTYGRGQTRWEAEREKNKKLRNGNPYGIWRSKDEWEMVKWLATEKVSQSSINKLLKTERVRNSPHKTISYLALCSSRELSIRSVMRRRYSRRFEMR